MSCQAPIAFPPLHLIGAAIFDLDGTLLDTETESTHAINLALDCVYRFRDFPAEYYGGWLKVALSARSQRDIGAA